MKSISKSDINISLLTTKFSVLFRPRSAKMSITRDVPLYLHGLEPGMTLAVNEKVRIKTSHIPIGPDRSDLENIFENFESER